MTAVVLQQLWYWQLGELRQTSEAVQDVWVQEELQPGSKDSHRVATHSPAQLLALSNVVDSVGAAIPVFFRTERDFGPLTAAGAYQGPSDSFGRAAERRRQRKNARCPSGNKCWQEGGHYRLQTAGGAHRRIERAQARKATAEKNLLEAQNLAAQAEADITRLSWQLQQLEAEVATQAGPSDSAASIESMASAMSRILSEMKASPHGSSRGLAGRGTPGGQLDKRHQKCSCVNGGDCGRPAAACRHKRCG